MNKRFTNQEKIIMVISVISLAVADFFRRYFIWTEMYIKYSILMSLLQGVFTVVLEYIILKKWIKNRKLLIVFLVFLAAFYFITYVVKVAN